MAINWSNILTGGISGLVGGGLGLLTGIFGRNQAEKQAEQSQKNALALLKEQENVQSRLNQENAELNYRYGEEAANQSWQRARADYETQKKDNSIENIIDEAKNAGVNPLAILGGGIGGAGGASVGNAAQGTGAGRISSQAPNYLEVEAARQQRKMADAEIQRTINESRLIQAEKNKLKAETENIKEEIDTGRTLTPIQAELMRQEGIKVFIENARADYENAWQDDYELQHYGNKILNFGTWLNKQGNFSRETAAKIAESITNEKLTSTKEKILWREILINEANSETEKVKANAIKLAAEWSTGEYTNWKTWVETAEKGVELLKSLITKQ